MPRHTDNTWLERISGYLKTLSEADQATSKDNASYNSVTSSASAVTVAPANNDRRTVSIFNDSTAVLYIGEFPTSVSTVSTTSYTAQVAAGGFYTIDGNDYNGIVQGIWASANGSARVTEH